MFRKSGMRENREGAPTSDLSPRLTKKSRPCLGLTKKNQSKQPPTTPIATAFKLCIRHRKNVLLCCKHLFARSCSSGEAASTCYLALPVLCISYPSRQARCEVRDRYCCTPERSNLGTEIRTRAVNIPKQARKWGTESTETPAGYCR